jgi:hypothetical protein
MLKKNVFAEMVANYVTDIFIVDVKGKGQQNQPRIRTGQTAISVRL